MNLKKPALALAVLALSLVVARAAAPALSLGWYAAGCDDALAQNPGAPEGCRYEVRERDCGNGVDDDSDERTDAVDPDCGACVPAAGGEDCADGADQDCDGYADCADPDCAFALWAPATWACAEPEVCGNGLDDDGDGLGDWPWAGSQDPDCFEICDDGVDNDFDSYADCADARCSEAPACLEDCGNGVDDADADDQVDCDDTECAPLGGCTGTCTGSMYCDRSCPEHDPSRCAAPENQPDQCADGVDNDLDGIVDCSDIDCDTWCLVCRDEMAANAGGLGNCSPTRLDQRCADGADNDRDLLADCLDPDCDSAEGCARCDGTKVCDAGCPEYDRCACDPDATGCAETEICGNGADDDGDLTIDCDDLDCAAVEVCFTVVDPLWCGDGKDNDGDGVADEIAGPLPVECPGEINCDDGLDNDDDGRADCADSDCEASFSQDPVTDERTIKIYFCTGGKRTFFSQVSGCDNGLDDDGNGPRDCRDGNCQVSAECGEGAKDAGECFDGYDNDADGMMDCHDDDCMASQPECDILSNTEFGYYCFNGEDDDRDRTMDCGGDPECEGENYFGENADGDLKSWSCENGQVVVQNGGFVP